MVGSWGTTGTITWTGNSLPVTCGTKWLTYTPTATGTYTLSDCEEEWYGGMMSRKLAPGVTYDLPDGAKLALDPDGNYVVKDEDAKVIYRANRVREFSPFINASDMVAEFVKHVGTLGVKRSDVLALPLHLFISWLIIEAAERDGDPVPGDIIPVQNDPLIKSAVRPKCIACGRFIRRLHFQNRFPFCSPEHGAAYVSRQRALAKA